MAVSAVALGGRRARKQSGFAATWDMRGTQHDKAAFLEAMKARLGGAWEAEARHMVDLTSALRRQDAALQPVAWLPDCTEARQRTCCGAQWPVRCGEEQLAGVAALTFRHWPLEKSQMRMVSSKLPDASRLPLGEKAQQKT